MQQVQDQRLVSSLPHCVFAISVLTLTLLLWPNASLALSHQDTRAHPVVIVNPEGQTLADSRSIPIRYANGCLYDPKSLSIVCKADNSIQVWDRTTQSLSPKQDLNTYTQAVAWPQGNTLRPDAWATRLEPGFIIAWVANSDIPPDKSGAVKWLECNGQRVDPLLYPDLYALVGTHVPDYRGLFLRGLGKNSGALGQIQEASFMAHSHAVPVQRVRIVEPEADGRVQALINTSSGETEQVLLSVPTQRLEVVSPTGTQHATTTENGRNLGSENVPVNTAVRYFIRAAW